MKRNFSFILAAGMGVFLVISTFAHAETVKTIADLPNNKRILDYIYSDSMLQEMGRLAVEQDRKFGLQQNCKSQHKMNDFSVSILSPIDFPDGKQHPIKGLWKVRYQFQRCGDSKFYNTMFLANINTDTPPTTRAYYPGSTKADPILIKDAMRSAIMNASWQSGFRDCHEIDVFDMRLTKSAHDVVEGSRIFKRVWNEIWTFRVCGKMVDVQMTFIPDASGGGTQFIADPAKLVEGIKKP